MDILRIVVVSRRTLSAAKAQNAPSGMNRAETTLPSKRRWWSDSLALMAEATSSYFT